MLRKMYEKVVCADGFTMSVQASEFSYCSPRENSALKYNEVEVGFPSTARHQTGYRKRHPKRIAANAWFIAWAR